MSEQITNAKQLPAVYFGLHFRSGVAEYSDIGKTIFINEVAAKKMDPTFQGKPVYVDHVDEVDLPNLEREIDGVVFDSFYNKADGNHWCRFEVHTDRGHEAIRKGWKLSNAYLPKGNPGPSGHWHGVEYSEEILDGEYEHLAIVSSPRYAESLILTPEKFKAYNESKEIELKRLTNSKQEKVSMLKLFKRTKVENATDIEGMMIELPLSKKEMSLTEVINGFDRVMNMQGYASDDHMVKVNDASEMSVKELRDKCNSYMEDEKKRNEEAEAVGSEQGAGALGEGSDKKMYPNAEEEEKKKKEMAEKKANEEKFNKLKNANKKVENAADTIVPVFDGVKRGKQLFGSN